MLANIVYGSKRRAQVGIERLVGEQIYTAAYPLHEVRVPLYERVSLHIHTPLRE